MDVCENRKITDIDSAKVLRQQSSSCESEDFADELRMIASFDDHLPDQLDYPLEPQEVLRLYKGEEIDILESFPSCMHSLHESVTATFVIAPDSSLPDGVCLDNSRGNLYGTPQAVNSPQTITIVGTFKSNRLNYCEVSLKATILVEVVTASSMDSHSISFFASI